jgi:hypothetical protein
MTLAKNIRKLLLILLTDNITVSSWGISNISISDLSIIFNVNAMKYKGVIEIIPIEDNYCLIKIGRVFLKRSSIGNVIKCIDMEIENDKNYKKKLENWLNTSKL